MSRTKASCPQSFYWILMHVARVSNDVIAKMLSIGQLRLRGFINYNILKKSLDTYVRW